MGTCVVRKQITMSGHQPNCWGHASCIMHERLFGTKGAGGAFVPARDSSLKLINLISDRAHAGSHSIEFDRRDDNAQIIVQRILFQVVSFN